MQSWVPVNADLIRGGYETHAGDDSDTYLAYAEYAHTYAGQRFVGDRVTISGGGDNIGDYQRDMGYRLQKAAASGNAILVYVDPDEPNESIIDRGIRWGMIGFKSIFVLVFGGFGLGLLIIVWRATPEKDASRPEYKEAPWLLNDDWQTPTIRSSSRNAMWGAWGVRRILEPDLCSSAVSGVSRGDGERELHRAHRTAVSAGRHWPVDLGAPPYAGMATLRCRAGYA